MEREPQDVRELRSSQSGQDHAGGAVAPARRSGYGLRVDPGGFQALQSGATSAISAELGLDLTFWSR